MTHNNSPNNAETVADDGPRWAIDTVLVDVDHLQFLGRAGPLDLWLDPHDGGVPFCAVDASNSEWAGGAERVIQRARANRVHLTLHDECIIYALCEAHTQPKETHHD